MKKASIIIRTKNEEKWISICLNAIFKQDYKNFEVIIDGMVDVVERGTARIAKIKNINVTNRADILCE